MRPALPADGVSASHRTLGPTVAAAFWTQPRPDIAHALRVHRRLWEDGVRDRDLLAAALLHDIGKSDARSRARLHHRIAWVVLQRLAPSRLRRQITAAAAGPARGLYLVAYHPELGAKRAHALGCSPRTYELIARHEERSSADADLRRLAVADAAG